MDQAPKACEQLLAGAVCALMRIAHALNTAAALLLVVPVRNEHKLLNAVHMQRMQRIGSDNYLVGRA